MSNLSICASGTLTPSVILPTFYCCIVEPANEDGPHRCILVQTSGSPQGLDRYLPETLTVLGDLLNDDPTNYEVIEIRTHRVYPTIASGTAIGYRLMTTSVQGHSLSRLAALPVVPDDLRELMADWIGQKASSAPSSPASP